ncbi:cysteine dioxygenase, partial [Streptomyces sp. NRRL WC-3701]
MPESRTHHRPATPAAAPHTPGLFAALPARTPTKRDLRPPVERLAHAPGLSRGDVAFSAT